MILSSRTCTIRALGDPIPMHAGHDPSDSERTGRAVALAGTLEALANHLERISGRRKTLLLFSEGIDYDQADVLGKVQRSANDVMHGMSRAVGALMRTNVALYAVDPRALNSADADLLETPIYNPTAVPTRTVADEQTDSIRTLHSLSESTGGFAAVNRNDFTGAFERIDLESSSYYVIGYSPERPAKPGEFRSIQVKVSRPDVTLEASRRRAGRAGDPVRSRGALMFEVMGYVSAPYEICICRTARPAIHRTNAVRSSSPRIAPGREAGAAGAASNLINVGASSSIGGGTGHSDCR